MALSVTSNTCPTPAKKTYKSKLDALGYGQYLAGKFGIPVRAYHCPCGSWHLTTHVKEKRHEYKD